MMYKFSPKSQRWIDSCNKKVEFRSSIDLHKCFEKNCTRTRLKPEVMEGECEECSKSGLSLWFCMEHQCHYQTECESSHNLFIGRKLLVSDMLLENKNLCEELGVYTMGDIAEIVCICCHENWHAGDILGSSFTSYQNRNKIVRHFDEKNAIDGWETEQASGYDDENYHEEDIMDPVLKPKQLNSNSKCSVWTCGIHHRNAPCWRCRDAGITRSYCDQHQKHKPNPGGIDHFSDMSANITVDDMLNENNLLCQQLVIIDKETSVFYQNRKNFVVSKCKELGWRSGDLIGNTFDANQRRDSMCCDLLLARDMLAMYSGVLNSTISLDLPESPEVKKRRYDQVVHMQEVASIEDCRVNNEKNREDRYFKRLTPVIFSERVTSAVDNSFRVIIEQPKYIPSAL